MDNSSFIGESIGEELASKEDLQERALKMVFGTFSLQKRRRIALELLNDAEIVTGIILPEVNPEFTRWICLNGSKIWPKQEVDRMWSVWNFVLLHAGSGYLYIGDRYGMFYPNHDSNLPQAKSFSIDSDEDPKNRYVTKEEFIQEVYRHVLPEKCYFNISDGSDDHVRAFLDPETTVTLLMQDQWHTTHPLWPEED